MLGNSLKHRLVQLCIWPLVLLLAACTQAPVESVLHGRTMGTTYNIKFVNSTGLDEEQLKQQIDRKLERVNALMSTYDPQSELSQFNQWQSTEPFSLSDETLLVMREAKRLGELSGGLLDVTVGPLVNLWGFGPKARPEKIPSPQQIEAVRAAIGLDKLVLDTNSARKLQPDLYVDLSTIAKGYGVDVVADFMQEQGVEHYLVEIGGEMRLKGVKASGQSWRVAIEKPISTERAVQQIISVGDNALATSGDYRNYYEQDGVRYSHLIDPSTGYPIQHNLVSVTVVHPSSMTADGLATALNIMGAERGLAFAEKHNLAVMLITREKDGFKGYNTAEFEPYLQ
ncbi:FAD:protein FMN transferase [Lacimicrobium alkaliphilum]|uniref:FAD:protein FMN transferase n=1 Tax=Lacimicrobium alkaliphilum TaxID=1526571 RepID=A0A0U2Z3K4_9ALTE|nr:FAD:protein FMN transferase [Lacimicrobium alkaliphilum]ALS97491.1 thiamine biosynthesis lipoprotein [Lacimicrobium alkaliphilum]